jgi:hypothetical protein
MAKKNREEKILSLFAFPSFLCAWNYIPHWHHIWPKLYISTLFETDGLLLVTGVTIRD